MKVVGGMERWMEPAKVPGSTRMNNCWKPMRGSMKMDSNRAKVSIGGVTDVSSQANGRWEKLKRPKMTRNQNDCNIFNIHCESTPIKSPKVVVTIML